MEIDPEQADLELKDKLKEEKEEKEYTPQQKAIIYAVMGLAVFGLFVFAAYFSPVYTGFDWSVFRDAVHRIFNGEGLYSVRLLNPPWFFIPMIPLALLPEKIGWAAVNAMSFMAFLLLAKRYNLHNISIVLLMISPPSFYNFVQGNIDILLLLAVFLPAEYVPLLAIGKPQVLLPMGLKVFHEHFRVWIKASVITAIVIALSFVFFGAWHLELLRWIGEQTVPLGHNVLFEIWPLQLVIAVPLILKGFERKDERFYLAAAPLMSSYASTGSYIGPVVAVASALKWWQLAALVLVWWVVYLS